MLPTILVEDNPAIRDALLFPMKEFGGMEIIAYAEGMAEARELLLETHKDEWRIAVLDLFLRQGNGLSVALACKGRRTDQRVIMLTNYATQEIRERCLAAGVDAVFDKSTELEEFFGYCRSLL